MVTYLKYFACVGSRTPIAFAVLAGLTGYGAVITMLSAAELDSALGLVLFAQMFLASSGFAAAARRGHFDPMLIHGRRRMAALVAECVTSIAPGAACWVLLASAGLAVGAPAAVSALVGRRLAALCIVSAVAWSAGFAMPRAAAGVVWLALLLVLLLRHADLPAMATSNAIVPVLRQAGVLLMCPFLLLGNNPRPATASVWIAVAAACLALLATWRRGARLDVFLIERS